MNSNNIPYTKEIFPRAFYTHGSNFIDAQDNFVRQEIEYDEIMRDAGKYIEKYQYSNIDINYDIDKYNFSVFRANDNTSIKTMHQGRIKFVSESINDVLKIPSDTQVVKFFPNAKNSINRELGPLCTQIYPDTDFMISLNYEDFPVGFLGFNIDENGNIIILQIQSSNIVDETSTFYGKQHYFLSGFDWAKVLITFFENYLNKKKFSGKIIIQSAENNGYYKKQKEKGKEITLEKRYNGTASDLGYERVYKIFQERKSAFDYIKEV